MILVGSLATLAMIAAPPGSFVDRVAFPFEFFMIMATLCLFPNQLFVTGDRYKHHVFALKSLGATLLVAVAIDSASMFRMYRGIYQQEQTRHQIIATAKDMGITGTITLPALSFRSVSSTIDGPISIGRYFARDITDDVNAAENFCYARAHQIDSVTLGYE